MSPSVKRLLYQIHKWTGLIIGLFLLMQAASGLILQYKPELNGLLYPVADDGERLGADQLAAAARRALPGADLDRLIFPEDPSQAILVRAVAADGGRLFAALDPFTGQAVAAGGLLRFPTEAALFLHHDLLLGPSGMLLIGVVGLGAVMLAVTGLILWWPRLGRIRRSLKITLKPPAIRYLYDLHKSPGAVFSALLLFIAVTGAGIAFRPQLNAAMAAVFEMQPPASLALQETSAPAESTVSLDAMVADARQSVDAAGLKDLRFAGPDDRLFGVLFWASAEADGRAVDQVWFDQATGERLDVVPASGRTRANRVLDWLLPLHTGEFAGATGRLLATATAMVWLLIGVTGLWLWWERHKLRRRKR